MLPKDGAFVNHFNLCLARFYNKKWKPKTWPKLIQRPERPALSVPGVFVFSNLFPNLTKIWTYINNAYIANNTYFWTIQVIIIFEEVYIFYSILLMEIYYLFSFSSGKMWQLNNYKSSFSNRHVAAFNQTPPELLFTWQNKCGAENFRPDCNLLRRVVGAKVGE